MQSKLQEAIADMDLNEVDLPGPIELILLFLLGLPGRPDIRNQSHRGELAMASEDSEKNLKQSLDYIPGLAPQAIKVQINISRVEGKKENKVEVGLWAAPSVMAFRWEDWINSIMGWIKPDEDTLREEEKNVWCDTVAKKDTAQSKY